MHYIFSMEATQLHMHLNYLEISKSLSFPFFFRKVWSWFQHHSLGLLFVSCLEYFWVQAVLIIKHIYSIYLRSEVSEGCTPTPCYQFGHGATLWWPPGWWSYLRCATGWPSSPCSAAGTPQPHIVHRVYHREYTSGSTPEYRLSTTRVAAWPAPRWSPARETFPQQVAVLGLGQVPCTLYKLLSHATPGHNRDIFYTSRDTPEIFYT